MSGPAAAHSARASAQRRDAHGHGAGSRRDVRRQRARPRGSTSVRGPGQKRGGQRGPPAPATTRQRQRACSRSAAITRQRLVLARGPWPVAHPLRHAGIERAAAEGVERVGRVDEQLPRREDAQAPRASDARDPERHARTGGPRARHASRPLRRDCRAISRPPTAIWRARPRRSATSRWRGTRARQQAAQLRRGSPPGCSGSGSRSRAAPSRRRRAPASSSARGRQRRGVRARRLCAGDEQLVRHQQHRLGQVQRGLRRRPSGIVHERVAQLAARRCVRPRPPGRRRPRRPPAPQHAREPGGELTRGEAAWPPARDVAATKVRSATAAAQDPWPARRVQDVPGAVGQRRAPAVAESGGGSTNRSRRRPMFFIARQAAATFRGRGHGRNSTMSTGSARAHCANSHVARQEPATV